MKKLDMPNYTQAPNILFDKWLPEIGDAELRVLLFMIRSTFGFHKKKARASLTSIQKGTGLSRQGVINGANAAIKDQLLRSYHDGGVTLWELIITDSEEPVEEKATEQIEKPTKKLSREENAYRYKIGLAIAEVTGMSMKLNTPRIMNEAKILAQDETVSPEKILKDYGEKGIWYDCFPGINGSKPTLTQIRSTWGNLQPRHTSSPKPTKAARPNDTLDELKFENL